MSGYYPPNPNIPPQYYNVNPNVNPNVVPNHNLHNVSPMMAGPPDGSFPHGVPESPVYGMPGAFIQYAEPQIQQTYMDQYDDTHGPAQGGNPRMRRRSAPGDHVKHRRTRSGCYTCRQRRVKCDETHPICERCRKGNRECVYPETQSAQKSGRSGSKSGKSTSAEGVSSPEDGGESGRERLPPITDDDEEEDMDADSSAMSKSQDLRESSDTPALTLDRSPSPSTEASSTAPLPAARPPLSRKGSAQATKTTSQPGKPTPGLTKDVQFYLNYFQHHISHHHYSLKRDVSNFLKGDFLGYAMRYEPLRYAVCGYAAYFHTLSQPNGRISTFLQFYNESVSRLRISITKNKKQGLATFLTVLQLASIEEVLGDWVNLMGHQKAAYEMLTRLYTPETITQSEFLLKILLWYIRFDLFVGFQSGGAAVLGREWYEAVHNYYAGKSRDNPSDISMKYEERFAYSRLVAKDSNDFFAQKSKGLLSDQEFMEQLPILKEKVINLEKNIDPALLDPAYKLKDAPGKPDPDDIVNPFEDNVIWHGPLWTSNYLLFDMWGIIFMYFLSESMALRKPFDPEICKKAYDAARTFEAVVAYPNGPPGSIIEAQASLAIATLYLPKDAKTIQWCRRTFAKIEAAGYIYSDVLRHRMLEAWGLPPSDWWLPNDENCPSVIRSIKDFIRDRTTAPKDQVSVDLREMRGIFSTLNLSDSPPTDTASSMSLDSTVSGGTPQGGVDNTLIYTGGSPEYEWAGYDRNYSGTEPYGSGKFSTQ